MKKLYLLPVVLLAFTGCLKEGELKKPFSSFAPLATNDGWAVSTPGAEQIDSLQLAEIYRDFHQNEDLWMLRSLLVFRNGRLVAESYTKDDNDREHPHAIWSCTKQVMGILTGIAFDKGMLDSLNDPIGKYLGEYTDRHPDKKDITLHNLLRMQSGIAYSNDGIEGQTDDLLRQLPDNSVDFILGLPMKTEQGVEFAYNDGNPHLMSAILQKQAGKPTDEWADEVLFSKLGIRNYEWRRYRDGVTFGGFGLLMTPRHLGKIAQCVLDEGQVNGTSVVSKSWLEQMLYPHSNDKDPAIKFGYYWWINPERNLYFMSGHGGQYAFIQPEKKLIVVMTAEPNTQDEFQFSTEEALEVVDRVLQAAQ